MFPSLLCLLWLCMGFRRWRQPWLRRLTPMLRVQIRHWTIPSVLGVHSCVRLAGSTDGKAAPMHRTQIWPLAVSLAGGALFGVRPGSGSGRGKGWPATGQRSYCRVGVSDACRAHAENLLSSSSAFFRSQRSINDAK